MTKSPTPLTHLIKKGTTSPPPTHTTLTLLHTVLNQASTPARVTLTNRKALSHSAFHSLFQGVNHV